MRSGTLPMAIGIAISPFPVIAVVIMLTTATATAHGLAFLGGWLIGLGVVGAIFLIIGGSSGASQSGTPGLSIDGLRQIHDTTVHAASQHRGREVYAFLRDQCGARFVQFIPIVERATAQTLLAANVGWGQKVRDRPLYVQQGNLVTERSVSQDGYGRFLIEVFEDWVRRDIGDVYVQMFDVALANWKQFGLAKRDTLPAFCRRCDVRFACHGGCPKDRFTTTPDGEPGLHYLCPSYKAFFGHIRPVMEAMCELLRAGRAPSETIQRYARADARRGRNERCTCGSGRKWKQCHGTDTGTGQPPGPRSRAAHA